MYKLKYCFIFGRELVGMLTQILESVLPWFPSL